MIDFAQGILFEYNPGMNSIDYEGVFLNPEGSRMKPTSQACSHKLNNITINSS
jgi:hypothetical protein